MINTNQEYLPKRCTQCRDLLAAYPDMGYYDAATVHSVIHEGSDEGHDYSGQNMILYADNRYSSVPLVTYLLREKKMYYVGTMKNRALMPTDLFKNRTKKISSGQNGTGRINVPFL